MRRLATLLLLALLAVMLLSAVVELPAPGSPEMPFRSHVSQHYLEQGAEEVGTTNIVKAVLLEYRLFDTFGEAAVIFTALAGVLAVLPPRDRSGSGGHHDRAAPGQVTGYVVGRTVPAIVIFGTYLVLSGHAGPGGAFQGGVILGAAAISLSLGVGSDHAREFLPEHVAAWLHGAAMVVFLLFAAIGPLTGAGVFAYPSTAALPWAREWLMLFIEAGIGAASAAIIASVFWSMEGRA